MLKVISLNYICCKSKFEKAIIDLQPFDFLDKYAFFNNLFQAINILAYSQSFVIVKKGIKASKKKVLRKTILICNWSKEYHLENCFKRNISTRKTNCLFDSLPMLEADGCIFWLRNSRHNHKATLLGVYPIIEKLFKQKKFLKVLPIMQKQESPHNNCSAIFVLYKILKDHFSKIRIYTMNNIDFDIKT